MYYDQLAFLTSCDQALPAIFVWKNARQSKVNSICLLPCLLLPVCYPVCKIWSANCLVAFLLVRLGECWASLFLGSNEAPIISHCNRRTRRGGGGLVTKGNSSKCGKNQQNILFHNQYGFRKNQSTSLALTYLCDKITSAIDRKQFTVNWNISWSF
jgi:hypothetical protein